MIRIGDKYFYTIEESREILLAIYPNYPDTHQRNPVPQDMYPPDSPQCKFGKVS